MFLNALIERNPEFIKTTVMLHQEGKIPANSYVLDIDAISNNVRILKNTGDKLNLKVFPMTKQIGRNPAVMRTMRDAGIEACVSVDMTDARSIFEAGLKIGHLGHLVQVPLFENDIAARMKPLYWTVYSKEKTVQVAAAASKAGYIQKILLRVFAKNDTFYTGHEGGFKAEEIVDAARFVNSLPGAAFAGITTFPALLYQEDFEDVKATHNVETLIKTSERLEKAGYKDVEINCPGTTSSAVMTILANNGATQVEPGHGLTGTTPLHAVRNLPEIPAMLYLSEVSHFYDKQAYCFGGGMYIDPVFKKYEVHALVGHDQDTIFKCKPVCLIPDPAAIDYYGRIQMGEGYIKTGDTVIFGFRCQAFVTRAYVVALCGVRSGMPHVEGIYDVYGKKAGWPV